MRKIYNKLTADQIKRGVIFSSTLTHGRVKDETTDENFTCHEVFKIKEPHKNANIKIQQAHYKELRENATKIRRLLDDSFFNDSAYTVNRIRNEYEEQQC